MIYNIRKTFVYIVPVLLLLISCLFSARSVAAEEKAKVQVAYFYSNVCELCTEELDFKGMFFNRIGIEREGTDIEFLIFNVYQDGAMEKLNEYWREYNVPEESRMVPTVFIGNAYLTGKENIEKSIKEAFLDAKRSGADTDYNASMTEAGKEGKGKKLNEKAKPNASGKTTIVYFYVTPCSECEEASALLDSLEDKYIISFQGKSMISDVEIIRLNIGQFENIDNANQYFQVYNVPEPERKAPIVFLGETYLSGKKAIHERLEEHIRAGYGLDTIRPDAGSEMLDPAHGALTWNNFAGALLTGLVNGLNPCSLSMLLFFLSLLVMKSANILKTGFSFIAGKFITYVSIGVLFYNLLLGIHYTGWIHMTVKIILLIVISVLVILNINDFLAARKENYGKIRLQLSASFRRFNHQWMKKITEIESNWLLLPVSFGLGAVISVGEFLCTGQIYMASIVYLMKNSTLVNTQALVLFLVYGLAFIAPLIVLTLVVYKGREIFFVSEAIRKRMHVIKFINVVIFSLMGIVVLVTF